LAQLLTPRFSLLECRAIEPNLEGGKNRWGRYEQYNYKPPPEQTIQRRVREIPKANPPFR
jgi:hypothetical protein